MSHFEWSPVGMAARLKELEAERDHACKLVAQMHHAATGYIQGPIRGVVEDIADLKTEREELRAEVERLRADAERYRWLRDGGADKSNIGVYGWFKRIDGKQIRIWLARQELDDSIDEALKEGQR